MYFDPSDFDFTSLSDVVSLDDTPAKQSKPTPTVDDATDLFNYSDIDINDDSEDEDYIDDDPNTNINDILSGQKDTRDAFSASEILENFDDYQPINFGDFTITKEELRNFKQDKDNLARNKDFYDGGAKAIENNIRAIQERHFMQNTVLEENIRVFEKRLQNPNITAMDYQETDKKLKEAIISRNILINDVNKSLQEMEEQKHLENTRRINEAVYILDRENQHWKENKEHIVNHLYSMGFTDKMIRDMGDVPLFKLATDSFLLNQNKRRIQEKLKNTTAVNARSTSGAKTSTRNASAEDKAAVKKAVSNMGTSRQANVDAFKYLKD